MAKEHAEQSAIFEMLAWQSNTHPELKLLFAIPNGQIVFGFLRRLLQGMGLINVFHRIKFSIISYMKAEGLKKGVPDLFLPVPNKEYHGLFIEMKRSNGGSASKEQKEWLKKLEEQGYKTELCHGSDEALKVMGEYLGIELT